jgi:hypothetical protein
MAEATYKIPVIGSAGSHHPALAMVQNNVHTTGPCSLCDGYAEWEVPWTIVVEANTFRPVCLLCVRRIAPELEYALTAANIALYGEEILIGEPLPPGEECPF